ncbi:hypothetical protein [Sulfitobacter sp. R18_1]|uniref:hypothetical protein n=1 Tax=Sulfitobacter sp. R18_1 TaxID=2821104 RepID=UPI001ADCF21E|nr:hypothetical protein [Sulfitobacter sp. R18_1]MBO9432531.1 hypothetical protein [Sulfitobacter sp. R18_1]
MEHLYGSLGEYLRGSRRDLDILMASDQYETREAADAVKVAFADETYGTHIIDLRVEKLHIYAPTGYGVHHADFASTMRTQELDYPEWREDYYVLSKEPLTFQEDLLDGRAHHPEELRSRDGCAGTLKPKSLSFPARQGSLPQESVSRFAFLLLVSRSIVKDIAYPETAEKVFRGKNPLFQHLKKHSVAFALSCLLPWRESRKPTSLGRVFAFYLIVQDLLLTF